MAELTYGNTEIARNQQQMLVDALQAQNGIQNQSDVFAQQQALANQLQGVANGTGPNPALAQLNNTTANNIANQASLMAGQRGTSANAGLLARQAAMQGGALQQQAVGQGAALQAQQQLSGMNALGAQQAQMANLAGTQVGQRSQAINQLNQNALGQQSNVLGGIAAQNNARVGMQSNINNANAGIASGNQQAQAGLLGGALGGVGSVLGLSHGGTVPHYAQGGSVGPQSFAGKYFSSMGGNPNQTAAGSINSGLSGLIGGGIKKAFGSGTPAQSSSQMPTSQDWYNSMTNNSGMPTSFETAQMMQSPEQHLGAPMAESPMLVNDPSMMSTGSAALPGNSMMASGGGKVPGKAEVKGDSLKNDVVDAKLSPGEIVIPRSILQGRDPVNDAARFVASELQKHRMAHGGMAKNYAEGGMTDSSQGGEDQKPVVVNVNTTPNAAPQSQPPPPQAQGNPFLPSGQMLKDAYSSNMMPFIPHPAPPAVTSNEIAQIPQRQVASNEPGLVPGSMSKGSEGALNQGNPDPYGDGAYSQNLGKAYQQQLGGIYGQAKAEGQLGKAQADIEQQNALKLQQDAANYQNNFDSLEKERNAFQKDIQDSHIDPHKYLGDMSTGQKMSTAIGLILGGIGGGLTHQENPALKFLNNQIENDINAQKANLGKKESLLSTNMRQFGNLKDATDMTRVMQMTMAETQLKKAAAEAQDPIAKARAMQAAGQLNQQMAPFMQQMARNKTLMQGSMENGGPSAAVKVRLFVPKEEQGEVFKELQESQNMNKARDNIIGTFDKVNKLATLGNRVSSPIQSSRQIKALTQPLTAALSKETAGRFTEQDASFLESLWPKPGDTDETVQSKKGAINKLITEKMNFPKLDQYPELGLNPSRQSRFGETGAKKIVLGPPKQ